MAMSSDLPGDIMINILSRLPVKSLMRFRCVSKSWRNLVSDPNFINMHLNQNSADKNRYIILKHSSDLCDGGYYLHSYETFVEHMKLEFAFKRSTREFEIVGSCNGLIFLLYPIYSRSDRNMHLWNPTIRKVKPLPNSSASYPLCNSSPNVVFGFGFLPQINDYRVVRIFYHEEFKSLCSPRVPPIVEVYSLKIDSWRRIEAVVPYFVVNRVSKAFVNGSVYWVATRRTRENRNIDFIMLFDMVREVFRGIMLPNSCLNDGTLTGSIAVFRESLFLFAHGNEAGDGPWDIWVMKEYDSARSWSKLFSIKRQEGVSWPLGFMKNGEVILETIDGELSLYDPHIQQSKKLKFHGNPDMLDVFAYMESLILLDRRNGVMG